MITKEERDRKVKVLLENENRQPQDDRELEELQAMQKFSKDEPKGEEKPKKKTSVKKK